MIKSSTIVIVLASMCAGAVIKSYIRTPAPVINGEIRILVQRATNHYGTIETPVEISTDWATTACSPVFTISEDAKNWVIRDTSIASGIPQTFFEIVNDDEKED